MCAPSREKPECSFSRKASGAGFGCRSSLAGPVHYSKKKERNCEINGLGMRPEDANQQSAPQCGTREGRRAPVRLFQVQGASVVQHVLLGYNVFGYLSIYSGAQK